MTTTQFLKHFVPLSLLLLLVVALPVKAEKLVIITSLDNPQTLNLDDVARIFLGKISQFPDGEEVVPLNLDPDDPSYEDFARTVLKKTPSQLKAYWAKRVFTGKGKPPESFSSAKEVLALVASDKRYLSYVDKNNVNQTVRWVIVLND